ncbi:juvenile hormone acid O-methyltransferase-like [Haemaphysalis longicornis]
MCTTPSIALDTRRPSIKDNWHLDVRAYERLRPHLYKENLRALTKVHLRDPVCTVGCNNMCHHQYLDVGCGPGNFTKEMLLPFSRPDTSRIVAVDRSHHAVEYAKMNLSHNRIAYDVFDVEDDDFTTLFSRYGAFDRVYSFFTFHYVTHVAKAYRNVAGLLKAGGSCAVVSIICADAIDVWDTVYRMGQWKQMIDPRVLFPGMYRCSGELPSPSQTEVETRNSISEAGLHCVSYTQYETRWKFSRIEDYLEKFMASFNAYDGVPPEDRTTYTDLWIELMQQRTRKEPGEKFDATYTLELVHAKKPWVH